MLKVFNIAIFALKWPNWHKIEQRFTQYMCKLEQVLHILHKSSKRSESKTKINAFANFAYFCKMCLLEHISLILRKSSLQIYAIWVSLNIYHIFFVKLAHKFTQYVYCYNIYHIFSQEHRGHQSSGAQAPELCLFPKCIYVFPTFPVFIGTLPA